MLGGIFRMSLVAAVFFIIVGGLLIFIDGTVLCIACNGAIYHNWRHYFPDLRCRRSYRQFRFKSDTE